MRIAIITFHRAYNCGAMLQAWALKTVLERMGHTVEFPSGNEIGRFPPHSPLANRCKEGSVLRQLRSLVYRLLRVIAGKCEGVRTGNLYDCFRNRYLPETRLRQQEFKGNFDVVVLGSDQVLNSRISGESLYFLCCDVPDEIDKIVYSASIGDSMLYGDWEKRIVFALRRFRSISFREQYKDFDVTLDPTLLLQALDYDVLDCKSYGEMSNPFLFMYSCSCTDFEINFARKVAQQLGLRLVYMHPWGKSCRSDIKEMVEWVSPDRFLRYIKEAEAVIAGSFHATAFSLIFHKRFVTLRTKVDDQMSRPAFMLNRLGLINRLANPMSTVEQAVAMLSTDVPEFAYKRLDDFRRESFCWLQNALRGCGE